MTSLAGRTALVTGSAHNLGRTIALELARTGARVVTHARTAADARATAEYITECTGAEAIPLAFDLGNVAAIEAGFDERGAHRDRRRPVGSAEPAVGLLGAVEQTAVEQQRSMPAGPPGSGSVSRKHSGAPRLAVVRQPLGVLSR